jgi:competence protein ComEA
MINQLRKIISDYFGFNRTETNGLILLLILMFILIFIPYIFRTFHSSVQPVLTEDKKLLDSLVTHLQRSTIPKEHELVKDLRTDSVFTFNPNTLSIDELKLLGIDESIANRIVKYRLAGGSYHVKSDLQKIYGLTEDAYDRLYPYIDLPEKLSSNKNIIVYHQPQKSENRQKKEILTEPVKIDLNLTDTTELKRVKGIGSKLSARIMKYGESLGGYVSVDQLEDVYGLKENALQQIKTNVYISDDFEPGKLKINFADWYTLVRHPYIDKKLANELIRCRSDHGPYRKKEDLLNIQDMSDSLVLKLEPYLEF